MDYKATCEKCIAYKGPVELCDGCDVRKATIEKYSSLIRELSHEEKLALLTLLKNIKASRSTANQSTLQEAI